LIFDKEIFTEKQQISDLKQNLIKNCEVSKEKQIFNNNDYFAAKKKEE